MEQFDFYDFFDEMNKHLDESVGHLYAIEYDDGIVKIGRTQSPERRMYTLTKYRGKYHKIIKVYISGIVQHSYYAEKKAMAGLEPVYGRECFNIPFSCAVKRVWAVTGGEPWFVANDWQSARKRFPNIERPQEALERLFDEFLSVLKNGSTQGSTFRIK